MEHENAYRELWTSLAERYGQREAQAIARLTMGRRFNLTITQLLTGDYELSAGQRDELAEMGRRLAEGEPVQYVLGEAEFCGRWFGVSPDVLVPRPETEELCRWITESQPHGRLLDIGTGSGCIAITLALQSDAEEVEAWDISDGALRVAERNAERLGAKVRFSKRDALNLPTTDRRQWDVIVSNPPYVCHEERAEMEQHVKDHEPWLALFVPDDDPLLFYRAIIGYAAKSLRRDGRLFFELNPRFARATAEMAEREGFACEIRNDEQGRERMLCARIREGAVLGK